MMKISDTIFTGYHVSLLFFPEQTILLLNKITP